MKVGEKAVTAGRITEGDQILGEGDLHGRAFEEHSGMPPELGTTLEETGANLVARRGVVVFLDRDGQRQIRGSETDTDEVEDFPVRVALHLRLTGECAGSVDHHSTSVVGGRMPAAGSLQHPWTKLRLTLVRRAYQAKRSRWGPSFRTRPRPARKAGKSTSAAEPHRDSAALAPHGPGRLFRSTF